jgi:hypothetical protein
MRSMSWAGLRDCGRIQRFGVHGRSAISPPDRAQQRLNGRRKVGGGGEKCEGAVGVARNLELSRRAIGVESRVKSGN